LKPILRAGTCILLHVLEIPQILSSHTLFRDRCNTLFVVEHTDLSRADRTESSVAHHELYASPLRWSWSQPRIDPRLEGKRNCLLTFNWQVRNT
ncbi:hypothetical protein KCU90_g210, partial [Aureobasidium melanogenum]